MLQKYEKGDIWFKIFLFFPPYDKINIYIDIFMKECWVISMEEKIELIKQNLTGDFQKDIELLNTLYDEENRIIDDAKTTIEAINIVAEAIKDVQSNVNAENEEDKEDTSANVEKNEVINEEVVEKEVETNNEIDNLIMTLLENVNNESEEEAIDSIEAILPKVEELTKSDENTLYCSFNNDFEKALFTRIFAGEKKVIETPYSNDQLYVIYAKLLLNKKKKNKALEAIDRAIYWNFLNREARELKLDIYYSKSEIVKYLDCIKSLQMIAYTPNDICDCYNKYAEIFADLKDMKSSYALYKLSYSYIQQEEVGKKLDEYEAADPKLTELTAEQIMELVEANDVHIGPNAKIIKARRDIAREYIENGMLKEAKDLIVDDYIMTNNQDLAVVYDKLIELEKNQMNSNVEEKTETEDKPKRKTSTKKTTEKKTSTKKANTKKVEKQEEEKPKSTAKIKTKKKEEGDE